MSLERSILIPGTSGVEFKASLAILGRTHHLGRVAVVANSDATFSGALLGRAKGYALIDEGTGLVVKSEAVSQFSTSLPGKMENVVGRESLEARLPTSAGQAPAAIAVPFPASPGRSAESRLEEVRRLRERGLITESEAAEQRRRILEGL